MEIRIVREMLKVEEGREYKTRVKPEKKVRKM